MFNDLMTFVFSIFGDVVSWLLAAEFVQGVSLGYVFLGLFAFSVIIRNIMVVGKV